VKVKIYVEGGGDTADQRSRCRKGFEKLLEKAGFSGRMPKIIPCGGRQQVYNDFKTAITNNDPDYYVILLVDSEDPLQGEYSVETMEAWKHLKSRDNWDQPAGVSDDQAQLMTTCMETWIMADQKTLGEFFGKCLRANALLPDTDLESRLRQAVLKALEHATKDCGRDKVYCKGDLSFKLLAALQPSVLEQKLPCFQRFISLLREHLPRMKG